MFKFSHSSLIYLSGFIWFVIGCFLLSIGLNFIVSTLLLENASRHLPIFDFLSPLVKGRETAALLWIAFALFIGFLKGRKIFSKSVNRSVNRILTLPNPASLSQIYAPSYYLLLGAMIGLGMVMKWTPLDIRGGVDIAVGSALINGAMQYFRQGWKVRQTAT